jgi:hypothetical protein
MIDLQVQRHINAIGMVRNKLTPLSSCLKAAVIDVDCPVIGTLSVLR